MYETVTFHDARWFDTEDLLNEEWRDIPGYVGVYQISNYGRVKRLEHTKVYKNGTHYHYTPLILKPQFERCGYIQLHLCKDNKKIWIKVHRIEAELFLARTPEQTTVNHKDGNKANPRLDNLEWVTQSENALHAIRIGLNPLKYRNLEQYDKDGNLVAVYDTVRDAVEATSCSSSNFYGYFNGHQKTLKGCTWKLKENA